MCVLEAVFLELTVFGSACSGWGYPWNFCTFPFAKFRPVCKPSACPATVSFWAWVFIWDMVCLPRKSSQIPQQVAREWVSTCGHTQGEKVLRVSGHCVRMCGVAVVLWSLQLLFWLWKFLEFYHFSFCEIPAGVQTATLPCNCLS